MLKELHVRAPSPEESRGARRVSCMVPAIFLPSPGAQAHWEPDPHMSPVLHLPFQKPWGVGLRAKFAI